MRDDFDSLDLYIRDINRIPLLTREEERDYARRWRNEGDREAAEMLVVANLRFVVKIASHYRYYGIKMSDLIQEGNIGLIRAVEKFDPEKGFRLLSYAIWWIRVYIQNFIIKSWSLVKIGTTHSQKKLFFQLNRARAVIKALEGTEDMEALSEQFGIPVDEIREISNRLSGRDFSLDQHSREDDSPTHLDLLVDYSEGAADKLIRMEEYELLLASIGEAKEHLKPQEKFVAERRFLAEKPLTLREIGEQLNLSKERIRQIESSSRRKMQKYLMRSIASNG
jgi:RNA polymerase sigma-32 factor